MTQPRTPVHRRVDAAKAKRNPAVISDVPSGWVLMSDEQYTPGCCVLLPDPVVDDLHAMHEDIRLQFLADMAMVGDILMEVTDSYTINYEIRGGADTSLFAEIIPRYKSEPEKYQKTSARFYYEAEKKLPPGFDAERDKELMKKIANYIQMKLE